MNHFSFKKSTIALAIAAIATALTSCGGGGSNNNAAAVITPTPTPSIVLTANNQIVGGGTLSYNNAATTSNKYVYTSPSGRAIDLTSNNISANIQNINTDSYKLRFGGSNGYTALRYGSYYEGSDTGPTIARAVFVTGGQTPIASVPTTGTAIYTGNAIHKGNTDSTRNFTAMTYNVDFANRTLSGSGTGTGPLVDGTVGQTSPNYTFNLTNGTIAGNSFSGSANTTTRVFADGTAMTTAGTFTGGFYGTTAQELGGIAEFEEDGIYNTAFGGRR